MKEAIARLEELLSKVESEQWVDPIAKRFIMSGIRIAIKALHHAKLEDGENNG